MNLKTAENCLIFHELHQVVVLNTLLKLVCSGKKSSHIFCIVEDTVHEKREDFFPHETRLGNSN